MDLLRRRRLKQLIQNNISAGYWMSPMTDSLEQRRWLVAYRQYLEATFAEADFAGVASANQRTPMALLSIFVAERFVERDIRPGEPDFAERMAANPGDELEDLLISWSPEAEPLEVRGRLVITGDPGSGKSALVRVIADGCSRRGYNPFSTSLGRRMVLPFILRELNLQGVRTTDDFLARWAERVHGASKWAGLIDLDAVKYYLARGWAIVAFDGVDEIGPRERRRLRRLVYAFAGRYPRAVILVTGRPVGFERLPYTAPRERLWRAIWRREVYPTGTAAPAREEVPPPPDFTHRFLRPFGDDQVENYIQRWFQARFPNDTLPWETKGKRLIAVLRDHPGFQRIQRRPIYLAILTYVHDVKGQLPNSFIRAYRQMVEAYLDVLEAAKERQERKTRVIGPAFDPEDRHRVLERLAFDLHHRRVGAAPAGEKSPFHLQLTEDEFDHWLADWLKEDYCPLHFTKSEIPHLRHFFLVRAGLLISPEAGVLRFSHLSFQEFLAGAWIFREKSEHGGGLDRYLREALLDRLHETDWHPVGLAFFGLQTQNEGIRPQESVIRNNWLAPEAADPKRDPGRFRFLDKWFSEGESALRDPFKAEIWDCFWQRAIAGFDGDWMQAFETAATHWSAWGGEVPPRMAARLEALPGGGGGEAATETALLAALPAEWLGDQWRRLAAQVGDRWGPALRNNPDLWWSLDLHGFHDAPREVLVRVRNPGHRLLLVSASSPPISILIDSRSGNRNGQLIRAVWAAKMTLIFCFGPAQVRIWAQVWVLAQDLIPYPDRQDLARFRPRSRPRPRDLACDLARTLVPAWAPAPHRAKLRVLVVALALDLTMDLLEFLELSQSDELDHGLSVLLFARSTPRFFATPRQALMALEALRGDWPDHNCLEDLFQEEWFPYRGLKELATGREIIVPPPEAILLKLYRLIERVQARKGKEVTLPKAGELPPGSLHRK
ncbi:MAG: NACHT domain-containing protein, partial [Magnetococcales bacterium]|nr:NACHT domain-containing protein [Magnetococcales bacterium]